MLVKHCSERGGAGEKGLLLRICTKCSKEAQHPLGVLWGSQAAQGGEGFLSVALGAWGLG